MSDRDPLLERAAQFAHDLTCGCWEGSPKGTPSPGLVNPEECDPEDSDCFSRSYPACTLDEPERWEEQATVALAFYRPLIEAEVREQVAKDLEARAAQFDERALGSPLPWARPELQHELLVQAGTWERAARMARGGNHE